MSDDSAYNPTLRPRYDVDSEPFIVLRPRNEARAPQPTFSLCDGDAALRNVYVRSLRAEVLAER